MSEGVELARSTFNRHKDAILDMFGIYIECDRQHGYHYYIGNDEELENDSVQNWLGEMLTDEEAILLDGLWEKYVKRLNEKHEKVSQARLVGHA